MRPKALPEKSTACCARRWAIRPCCRRVLTLPVLPFVSWPSTASLAGCLYWLAAIWLAIGWRRRNALLFAAHQIMLTLATGVATAAWLKHQSWMLKLPGDLLHPYSLQAFGIALGVLSLLWIVARIVLRGNATAEQLLNSSRPTVDWVLRHAWSPCSWRSLSFSCYPARARN